MNDIHHVVGQNRNNLLDTNVVDREEYPPPSVPHVSCLVSV